jgi:hypothetical protein
MYKKNTPGARPPLAHSHTHGFAKGDEEEAPVAFDEFYQWAAETFPLLYQCFGAFVYARVCPGLPIPQVRKGVVLEMGSGKWVYVHIYLSKPVL